MVAQSAFASDASSNRVRNDGSFSRREMRASAFRCAPRRVLRCDEQEEQMRRLAVERLKIDAGPAARERGDHPPHAGQLPVRDRDAVAERGAVQPLAFFERADEPRLVQFGVAGRDGVRELHQDFVLAPGSEVGDDEILAQDVLDLHGLFDFTPVRSARSYRLSADKARPVAGTRRS
jgi:hypothetical protein